MEASDSDNEDDFQKNNINNDKICYDIMPNGADVSDKNLEIILN